MDESAACRLILEEVRRAEGLWSRWPVDPVHAAAVMAEEAGESVQAALDFCYSGGSLERIRDEAVQCGAMAIRVLKGLEKYERITGYDHREQGPS